MTDEDIKTRMQDLEERIKSASLLMVDWDGYYDPETKKGNVEELAKLIEDTFRILQNGRSWRDKRRMENTP